MIHIHRVYGSQRCTEGSASVAACCIADKNDSALRGQAAQQALAQLRTGHCGLIQNEQMAAVLVPAGLQRSVDGHGLSIGHLGQTGHRLPILLALPTGHQAYGPALSPVLTAAAQHLMYGHG